MTAVAAHLCACYNGASSACMRLPSTYFALCIESHSSAVPAMARHCTRVEPDVACSSGGCPCAAGAVGLYVPGGTAVLPSSTLMMAVPAQIAGCKTIVMATPPRADGQVHSLHRPLHSLTRCSALRAPGTCSNTVRQSCVCQPCSTRKAAVERREGSNLAICSM